MDQNAKLSVPATSVGIGQAVESLRTWCERQGLPGAARDRLLTVLDELLSNVARHGMRGQTGSIEVHLACRDGVLEARVVDEAAPFNPLLLPPPDTSRPLEERAPGGLGIALVRALADDVRYERTGHRNQVTVTWRLGPPQP
jgi:anti-sigma regulatory factor (Ser/Thr protein kinase)